MIKRGTDIFGGIASLEGGLWGYPGFDEDSIGAMSLFSPLGPWPECVSPLAFTLTHLTSHSQRPTHMNKLC